MKVDIHSNIESTSIGDLKEIETGIAKENAALVMFMTSENLYSNPIESLIRELVSNAYDAHVEIDTKELIKVEIKRNVEDSSYQFIVKDSGIGISEARMKKTYSQWFSSTKRKTNENIGGWGLGSKSPLAYIDMFYLNTVNEGIKYEYIVSKGDEAPEIVLLTWENTHLANGTEVVVDIKTDNDAYAFLFGIKNQLAYFEGIYVTTAIGYYQNSYKIYEGKHFKFNNNNSPSEYLHICLGQVAYNLDTSIIDGSSIKSPIALSFDIGELDVTMDRESVNYTPKTKEAIEKKLILVKEEIQALYEKQDTTIEDFKDYLPKAADDVTIKLNEEGTDVLKPAPFKLKTRYVYSKLKDVGMPVSMDILTKILEFKLLKNGKFSNAYTTKFDMTRSFSNGNKVLLIGFQDVWSSRYQEDAVVVKFLSLSKLNINAVRVDLNLIDSTYSTSRARMNTSSMTFQASMASKYVDGCTEVVKNLGWSLKIYTILKTLKDGIREDVSPYTVEVSEEWKEEWKEENKASNSGNEKERRDKGAIYGYDEDKDGREYLYSDLNSNLVVFYDIKSNDLESKDLNKYKQLLSNFSGRDKVEFLYVSKTNVSKLKKNTDRLKHIDEFFKVRAFHNYLYRGQLDNDTHLPDVSTVHNVSSYYSKKLVTLGRELKECRIDTYLDYFSGEIEEVITKVKATNKVFLIEDSIKEIQEFIKKIRLFTYIDIHTIPNEYLVEIAKIAKLTKLRSNFYTTIKEEEHGNQDESESDRENN